MNKKDAHRLGTCQVCQQDKAMSQLLSAEMVRGGVLNLITTDHPDWKTEGWICFTCLNQFRARYVQQLMEKDLGELDQLEQEVVNSMKENELLSENLNEEYDKTLSRGERISDRMAEFGGSWKFIIWFGVVLFIWITINSAVEAVEKPLL